MAATEHTHIDVTVREHSEPTERSIPRFVDDLNPDFGLAPIGHSQERSTNFRPAVASSPKCSECL